MKYETQPRQTNVPVLQRIADTLSMWFARPDPRVASDADALIAGFGDGAYEEARRRSIDERRGAIFDGNRSKGHWDRVRREIGRRMDRDQNRVDTATRWTDG